MVAVVAVVAGAVWAEGQVPPVSIDTGRNGFTGLRSLMLSACLNWGEAEEWGWMIPGSIPELEEEGIDLRDMGGGTGPVLWTMGGLGLGGTCF